MAKDEPVSTPGPSRLTPERDPDTLRDLLTRHGPPTFEGAVKRRQFGAGDYAVILAATLEAMGRGMFKSRNEALTCTCTCYWRLFDERKGES